MVAAVYSTDLVDIIAEMPASTGWTLITDGGGGGNSFSVPETDDYVQGANCISRNPWTSANIRGMVYNSAQTVAAGNAVFIWWKADVAQALRTKANGGIQCLIGSSTTDLKCYYVAGSDTYTFGGWQCTPIDPTATQSFTLGSPTSTTSFFGVRWGVAVSGPSKGFPYKIDAIRRGRTLQITGGDVSNGYATFVGAANWQGDISRQWGLFQLRDGTYTQQGLFLMGTAATAVDFRDANRTIAIANTEYVQSSFNTFEIRNAASRVDWTNVSFLALGTVSKGRLLVTDNATVNLTDCTFTDLDTFTFRSNTTVTNSTFRRCGLITPAGATITNSTITASAATTGAIVLTASSDADGLTNCNFTNNAKAIRITTAGTYSFNGHQFSGNTVQVDFTGTGTCTINPSNGCNVNQALCVATGGGSIVVNAQQVSLTITGIKTNSEIRIIRASDLVELGGSENVTSGSFTFNHTSAGEVVHIYVHHVNYQWYAISNYTLLGSNASIPISQVLDRQYFNP